MRKLGLSLLACAAAWLPFAARSQDAPPTSAEDYVCTFSGDCGDDATETADEPGVRDPDRPRVSASRGFSLSTTNTPNRPSSNRPRRPGSSTVTRRRAAQGVTPRQPAAASGQRVNLRLSFETGSARLTAAAAAQARVFGQALQLPQLANMRFRIEGHTDAVGSRAMNLDLSQRRAQSVADFLVAMGVPRNRLEVRGYGPDRPLEGTGGANAQNRRVEAVRVS